MKQLCTLLLTWGCLFANAQVIKQSGFDRDPVNYDMQLLEGSKPYSVTRSNNTARFELRASDPQVTYGNKRAEITVFNNYWATDSRYTTDARWYSFRTYQAASEWKADTREEIWPFQFHDKSSGCSTSPPLAMQVISNKFRAVIRYSTQNYCTYPSSRRMVVKDLVAVPFDKWNDWIVYYDPRTDANGKVKVWLNGALILDYSGPCQYIGSQFPYLKIGIYKWVWMQSVPSGLPTIRVGYIDDIKVGGSKENWAPQAANQLPSLSIYEYRRVLLVAHATDLDGTITGYEWSEGGKLLGNNTSLEYTGRIGTSATVTCTVTDDRGGKAIKQYSVTF